jgi:5-methyltetrahydrofolate--homocysteine methyltransferase
MSRFLEALRSGRVLLMDGAMGTELIRQGLQPGENSATWNILHPERVRAVHQAYVDAGAEVLLTNTFQSNPIALATVGYEEHLESINQSALAIARSVAGPDRIVLADVGPLMAPALEQDAPDDAILRIFAQGIRSLRGADALLFETRTDGSSVSMGIQHGPVILYDMPLLISFTFARGFVQKEPPIRKRPLPTEIVRGWRPPDWAALGVNCGTEISVSDIGGILRHYRQETDLPLFARPNAGTPVKDGDQWRYPHTPAIMAERLPELLEAGVSMVGGCCGTTPEHIAAFRPIVDAWNAR